MSSCKNIALNNYCAGSGKDTVADILCENYDYKHLSLSDGIYEVAHSIFGIPKNERPPRKLLQHIGESLRQYNPSLWVDIVLKKTKHFNEIGYSVVISDVRKEMEHVMLKANGFNNIMVVANDDVIIERLNKRDKNNVKELDTLKNDILENQLVPFMKSMDVIENNGTFEDLKSTVYEYMKRKNFIEELTVSSDIKVNP